MLSSTILAFAVLGAFGVDFPDGGTVPKADIRAVKADVGDLSGYYTCKGVEAGGKAYSGVAVLVKKNDVYLIQWVVGGGSTFSGLAIRQGDSLSASWAIPNERGIIRGVNVYKIDSNQRLVGRWTSLPGPGVLQSETLTFLKKLEVED
jgi:hypothetical protein